MILVVAMPDRHRLRIVRVVRAEKRHAGRIVVDGFRFQLVQDNGLGAQLRQEACPIGSEQPVQTPPQPVIVVLGRFNAILRHAVKIIVQPILHPIQGLCRHHDVHDQQAQDLRRSDFRAIAVGHELVEQSRQPKLFYVVLHQRQHFNRFDLGVHRIPNLSDG